MLVGQSGCDVELLSDPPVLFIRKTSSSLDYDGRLTAQAVKQASFCASNTLMGVAAPRLLRSGRLGERWSIDMQYCHYDNCIDFLQSASPSAVETLTERLLAIIDQSLRTAPVMTVPSSIVRDKCDVVCGKILTDRSLAAAHDVVRRSADLINELIPVSIRLPIGPCHGDMSLSNILIGPRSDVVLIDFLDVFIDTPLHDVVKLRQDTCHHWALLMYQRAFDAHRVKMSLRAIDERIVAHVSHADWYAELYLPFQVLNFMRILQYSRDERRTAWVMQTLERLMSV